MSYVPSEETLRELGFEVSRPFRLIVRGKCGIRFAPSTGDFWIEDTYHGEGPVIYPKSDEELRLLISIMTP